MDLLALKTRYQDFIRYFIVGVSAVLLDTGSLFLLKEFAHFTPVQAVASNQPLVLLFVFTVNKQWSFSSTGNTGKQMIKFFTLAGANYLFSLGWIWLMAHELGLNYLIARLANIILAVGWNFLLYKHWVYKKANISQINSN